jgi:acyl-homoserine-lactone acylase
MADPASAVRALAEATRSVAERYGSADVRWGDVHHAKVGRYEVEAPAAPGDPGGVFRVGYFQDGPDGIRRVQAGDSWYALLDFGPDGVQARVLLAYGNATQPGSTHVGDQLELYGAKRMRTPWRARAEIEANLESRTDLTPSEEGR